MPTLNDGTKFLLWRLTNQPYEPNVMATRTFENTVTITVSRNGYGAEMELTPGQARDFGATVMILAGMADPVSETTPVSETRAVTLAQYDALCTVIDTAKTTGRVLDTDQHVCQALEALGLTLQPSRAPKPGPMARHVSAPGLPGDEESELDEPEPDYDLLRKQRIEDDMAFGDDR